MSIVFVRYSSYSYSYDIKMREALALVNPQV